MRRLHEMLREANGPEAYADLDTERTERAKSTEGKRGHYKEVLEEQLGEVATDALVVKNQDDARDARSRARTLTEEHKVVPPSKLVTH
jgi:hypothetical protein